MASHPAWGAWIEMGIKSGMGNTVIYRLRNEAGEITAGKEIGHAKSSGMENPAAFLLAFIFLLVFLCVRI